MNTIKQNPTNLKMSDKLKLMLTAVGAIYYITNFYVAAHQLHALADMTTVELLRLGGVFYPYLGVVMGAFFH